MKQLWQMWVNISHNSRNNIWYTTNEPQKSSKQPWRLWGNMSHKFVKNALYTTEQRNLVHTHIYNIYISSWGTLYKSYTLYIACTHLPSSPDRGQPSGIIWPSKWQRWSQRIARWGAAGKSASPAKCRGRVQYILTTWEDRRRIVPGTVFHVQGKILPL